MIFGGLQRFSLIDYPGELTAIVFTIGCNFRCPYCHNPELVNRTAERLPEDKILSFLNKRRGKLTAVSITGGEPTIHGKELLSFIKAVKNLGYKVKIDTNGTNPELLETLIKEKLIDYVAMDVKAPMNRYGEVVRANMDTSLIEKSIDLILDGKVPYEFRTTVLKGMLDENDIEKILKTIKAAQLYCIQNFIPTKTLNPSFLHKGGLSKRELEKLKILSEKYVKICQIR